MGGRIVVLVALVALAGTAVAAGNQPPLADAGLDQRVELGETVLIDAMGSGDPDGTLATHDWRIETPDGTAIRPACPDCPWTRFEPAQVGTYTVTLTVTDDDGASQSDRLYVTVRPAPGTGSGSPPAGTAPDTGPGIVPPSTPSETDGGDASGPTPNAIGNGDAVSGSATVGVGGGPVDPPAVARRETRLAPPQDNTERDLRDIFTIPTISPFGNDVGGVTYFTGSDGETTSSTDAILGKANRTK